MKNACPSRFSSGEGGECELGACCRRHWSPQPPYTLSYFPACILPAGGGACLPPKSARRSRGKGTVQGRWWPVSGARPVQLHGAMSRVRPFPLQPRPGVAVRPHSVAVKERGQKGSRSSNREFPDAYRCEIQSFMSRSCPCLNLVVSVIFFFPS